MKVVKKRILFLCTGNSCRSQMAEGWARHLLNGSVEAYSAGIEKKGLDRRAVKVMEEAGVDISSHKSKLTSELPAGDFDYVITVCSHADANCPLFPAKTRIIHRGFDDPPKLALTSRNEEEALAFYRRVRDEIREFVASLPETLCIQP